MPFDFYKCFCCFNKLTNSKNLLTEQNCSVGLSNSCFVESTTNIASIKTLEIPKQSQTKVSKHSKQKSKQEKYNSDSDSDSDSDKQNVKQQKSDFFYRYVTHNHNPIFVKTDSPENAHIQYCATSQTVNVLKKHVKTREQKKIIFEQPTITQKTEQKPEQLTKQPKCQKSSTSSITNISSIDLEKINLNFVENESKTEPVCLLSVLQQTKSISKPNKTVKKPCKNVIKYVNINSIECLCSIIYQIYNNICSDLSTDFKQLLQDFNICFNNICFKTNTNNKDYCVTKILNLLQVNKTNCFKYKTKIIFYFYDGFDIKNSSTALLEIVINVTKICDSESFKKQIKFVCEGSVSQITSKFLQYETFISSNVNNINKCVENFNNVSENKQPDTLLNTFYNTINFLSKKIY